MHLPSTVIFINLEIRECFVLAQVELLRGVSHRNLLVLACIDLVAGIARLLLERQGLRSLGFGGGRDDYLRVEELLLWLNYLSLIVPFVQELALSKLLIKLLYILHLLLGVLHLFLLKLL